tara:strand:+ start:145 stop:612 length:468 start_codon:yes stop_codon:yes gene_type:complete
MKEHPTHKGYFVTEDGRVFSSKRGTLIEKSQCYNFRGYKRVSLFVNKKMISFVIHRLVAETYLPNPNNLPQINHKDEDKTNNHISNLEWCNSQYNNEYSKSKQYKVLHIESGEIIDVFNLRKWCREKNISDGSLRNTRKSLTKHAKGYRLLELIL